MPANTAVESRPGEEAPKVAQPDLAPAEKQLEDKIARYDLRSRQNQRWAASAPLC